MTKSNALFRLGQIVATPGAMEALVTEGADVSGFLLRHMTGDWGDLSEDDKRENEESITRELRILSAYTLARTGVKIWIITEADRSATTLLLPDEY